MLDVGTWAPSFPNFWLQLATTSGRWKDLVRENELILSYFLFYVSNDQGPPTFPYCMYFSILYDLASVMFVFLYVKPLVMG